MCDFCGDDSCSCNPQVLTRGPQGSVGPTGPTGANGYNGWSPLLGLIQNNGTATGTGIRYSMQFNSWTGGTGTPPSSPTAPNIYLQADGTFGALSSAVNLVGPAGVTMVWLGTFATAPISPSILNAYRDSALKMARIWNGSAWQEMVEDGLAGSAGAAGANGTSIVWKGSLASAPVSPALNWGYYDTVQKKSFIWDGSAWQIIAIDGTNGTNGANGFNYETVDGNGIPAQAIGFPNSLLMRKPDDTGYEFVNVGTLKRMLNQLP